MRIKASAALLQESLSSVASVVSQQTPRPVLADFYLEADRGRLWVEATDLEIGARIEVADVEVESTGKVAVPAGKFLSVIRELRSLEEIEIEALEETRGVQIRGPGVDLKLLGHDPEEFPRIQPVEGGRLPVDRARLLEGLGRVAFAASRDDVRYQIRGVSVRREGNNLKLAATNGKRLATFEIELGQEAAPQGEIQAILPLKAVDALQKLLTRATAGCEIAFSETAFCAFMGDDVLLGGLIEGAYPDYERVVPRNNEIQVRTGLALLLEAVRRAALVTSRDAASVIFSFEPGRLHLRSESREYGAAQVELELPYEGKALEVRFNPGFILEGLRAMHGDSREEGAVELFFKDGATAALLKDRPEYSYVVMPVLPSEVGP